MKDILRFFMLMESFLWMGGKIVPEGNRANIFIAAFLALILATTCSSLKFAYLSPSPV